MKLIRWVEVHIGRSRRRTKKTPKKQQESPGFPSESCPAETGCRAHLDAEPRASSLLPAGIRTSSLASPARQRNRIKTNPWIAPSSCSSADSGWAGSRSSTDGDDPTASMGCLRAADDLYQLPESVSPARRELTGGSSDDEAYSEDFLQSEGSNDAAVKTPQTDSACGSSCTTTPLSECSSRLTETLADKVRRLQADRAMVEQKMLEARVEEQASRCQRMQLHREMMQLRRLTLVHSLQELRSDLEQCAAFRKTLFDARR
ncbi:uncharacterized protein LOC119397023 [Rhipicephalus sanguineus]|uniref:Uncharacterized protein n=1 Tax=Rhipicephalus sanguineus TaxID=34632 RepID=A0A9D4PN55_RHISA|nr:uncharacterized protein LOC119397023 [Rhipicephalus sanguineus]KAH7947770.1 hypothetical protein HPB52_015708 [Rhipicephalus sanguineus]